MHKTAQKKLLPTLTPNTTLKLQSVHKCPYRSVKTMDLELLMELFLKKAEISTFSLK